MPLAPRPARFLIAALLLGLPACTAPAPAAEPALAPVAARPATAPAAVDDDAGDDGASSPDGLVAVVVPRQEVAVAPRRAGTLASVDVGLGDAVSDGQVVARLDDTAASSDLDAATSGLRAARAEARRAGHDLRQARDRARRRDRLVADGVLASEEAEDARFAVARAAEARSAAAAEVERAEAAVAQLGRDRTAAGLTATFRGRVAAVHRSIGAQIAGGERVVTIVSDDRIVRFAAPAGDAALLVPGAAVAFALPDGSQLPGRIATVAPELDRGARMWFAEAVLDDGAAPPLHTVGRLRLAQTGPQPEPEK